MPRAEFANNPAAVTAKKYKNSMIFRVPSGLLRVALAGGVFGSDGDEEPDGRVGCSGAGWVGRDVVSAAGRGQRNRQRNPGRYRDALYRRARRFFLDRQDRGGL